MHSLVGRDAFAELRLVAEADEDDDVVDGPGIGGLRGELLQLVHGCGPVFTDQFPGVQDARSEAGKGGIGDPHDEVGGHEVSVQFVGIDQGAVPFVADDRVAVVVVDPVVELVATGVEKQGLAIGLSDRQGSVGQGGGQGSGGREQQRHGQNRCQNVMPVTNPHVPTRFGQQSTAQSHRQPLFAQPTG